MPELVFFRRGEEVLRLSLGEERVILGRGDRCDVVIPDPQVSRQHVALHMEDGRCILQDLSGKGAEVAGKKIELGEIADGADIALGQWQALYRRASRGSDSDATERFLREARAASALNHPNVITVYDIGRGERGWYIAMELVKGRTLSALVDGSLDVRSVAGLGAQAARALAVAHDASIVHRDIKPDNLMLREDGYL